jgi:hypothetical protein
MENNNQERPTIPAVEWMKKRMADFRALTKKDANDNVWILGFKVFIQIIAFLLLLIMSPFAIFAIVVSIMVTS